MFSFAENTCQELGLQNISAFNCTSLSAIKCKPHRYIDYPCYMADMYFHNTYFLGHLNATMIRTPNFKHVSSYCRAMNVKMSDFKSLFHFIK